MKLHRNIFVILTCFLLAVRAQAQVELPTEELAKESVVPKFDNSTTVKSRNVILDHKFETGIYYGWNFAEAVENQSKIGLNLGYHWNEISSVFINYAFWQAGLNTQYTSGLSASPFNLDMSRAPALQSSLWVHYEWNAYYGKISITKKGISNMTVYPIVGVGSTAYSNKSYMGIDGGIGAKFYFSPRWALRTDFKFQYSGQPSPFLKGSMKTSDPQPSQGQFQDTNALGTILDIGLVALF